MKEGRHLSGQEGKSLVRQRKGRGPGAISAQPAARTHKKQVGAHLWAERARND